MGRTLEITTVDRCPMMCKWCPQENYINSFREVANGKTRLDLEDFKLALNHTPKDVEIVFSGYTEPFLNPKTSEMILYAYKAGYSVILDTTLDGLTPQKLEMLKEVKFKSITLHTLDNLNNTHIPITEIYKEVLVKFMSNFRIDRFSTMNENFTSNERAGLSYGAKNKHIYGFLFCTKLSIPQFVMLPNGNVQLCCMDFGLKHKVGNLFEQTYDEIENGPEYKKIKRNKWAFTGDTLCRSCKWASLRNRIHENVYGLGKRFEQILEK